jgi:hypothetical protein
MRGWHHLTFLFIFMGVNGTTGLIICIAHICLMTAKNDTQNCSNVLFASHAPVGSTVTLAAQAIRTGLLVGGGCVIVILASLTLARFFRAGMHRNAKPEQLLNASISVMSSGGRWTVAPL